MTTKHCTICNCDVPLDLMVKNSRSKDGYGYRCKPCHRIISKRSVEANPESRKAACAKYYRTHKEAHNARVRDWQRRHPETVKAIAERHKPKGVETSRAYRRRTGLEQLREQRRRYPERFKARNKVNNSVAKGIMPRAKTLPCSRCGAPATEYHHHNGYDYDHWLDVVPVCRPCHAVLG